MNAAHARYLLGGLAGVLLVLLLGHTDVTTAVWEQGVIAERHTTAAWLARTRGLEGAVAMERTRAKGLAGQLAQARDSLHAAGGALLADTVSVDTGAVRAFVRRCEVTLTVCEAQAVAWHAAADSETARADLNFTRAARADSLLAVGVKAVSCHLAFVFGCPDRKQSIALGVLVGLVVRSVVR